MKKLLTLVLALVLVLTSLTFLTACNEDKTTTDDKGKTELKVSEHSPNVPDGLKFDGESFDLFIGVVGYELFAEEETGDIVNDLVYKRNLAIEEQLGIDLNVVKNGYNEGDSSAYQTSTQAIQTLIMSNDDTYEAFTHVQHAGMPELILQKNFVDWNTIPYVKLSEPWWYHNITNDLCFGDKVYVMTGDYAMYVKRLNTLVFNKDIFDELNLEYPYQDVIDGTWTFDKFQELVMKGKQDLDGDGVQTDVDRYGLVGWTYEMDLGFLVSLGYQNLEKDADNMPVLNQNTDLATDIYDKIINLYKSGNAARSEMNDWTFQHKAFHEGRAMFKDFYLMEIEGLRDVEFDFGVLPFPKYDENSEYQTRSANMTTLTYIPVTNTKLELTGAVLEELAYRSYQELTPAYFETVLTVKNTRDDESAAMLPIIRDSARFLYQGFYPNIILMVNNKNNTYASEFAANRDSWLQQLADMREMLLEE